MILYGLTLIVNFNKILPDMREKVSHGISGKKFI